tara:strand:+ start:518 stop:1168 length:651 start_codon:yes stop_codon:yes gene_type:complete
MISLNLKKRFFTSLILFLILFLIFNFKFFLIYFLLVFGIFSAIEFFDLIKKITKDKILQFFQNLIFIFFVATFIFFIVFFSSIYQLKIIVFILLFGCIASDIGGLIVGKIFKGPRLTKISPNKTIAGAIGSIFFTIIIVNILFFYFFGVFSLNLLAISICNSIGCQIGDIFFSFLKRKAKIKDTGNILPGHGGILDRVDGIILGIPIGFISLILLY